MSSDIVSEVKTILLGSRSSPPMCYLFVFRETIFSELFIRPLSLASMAELLRACAFLLLQFDVVFGPDEAFLQFFISAAVTCKNELL